MVSTDMKADMDLPSPKEKGTHKMPLGEEKNNPLPENNIYCTSVTELYQAT